MSQDIKPHQFALQCAIERHSTAMSCILNYKVNGQRKHIDAAREAHQQFRKWKKMAIKQAQQFATDAEFDALLDRLDELPHISPAATLLDDLTGAAA